ncbi:MAG: hypothetical protein BMS9Abin04_497 [Planctomycetia bacterium]|nr:MAG: hypothetical protein BMS9Abin04_497 [Planctomycetia bacterium]
MIRHTDLIRSASLAALSVLVVVASGQAEPVSYFRCDRGVAPDDRQPLPDRFDSPDQLVWRQELAPGHSTPCISGASIFVTTFAAEQQELAVVALDRATGQVRWRRPVPAAAIEPFHRVGSPAASTPACDGERLYVFFGSYGLLCYSTDGDLLWSKRMGPFQNEFGAASSPVLVDDKVILNEDHDVDSFLLALDRTTGKTVWKVVRDRFTRSYSTPIVWRSEHGEQIIVAGSLQLTAYDAGNGRRLWWVRGLSRIVDTTPVVADNFIYLATWTPGGDRSDRIAMGSFAEAAAQYDKDGDARITKRELPAGPVQLRFFRIDLNQDGALDEAEWSRHAQVFELAQNVAMAVRLGGEGDVTDTHVQWIHRKGLPTVPSPLVHRGVLYMVKDSGIMTSLDAASGKLLKRSRVPGRGNYYASPVTGDGKVYVASERGVVTVLRAGGDWQPVSHHDFGERIMATPVIRDGRIYLRTEQALYCFGKR